MPTNQRSSSLRDVNTYEPDDSVDPKGRRSLPAGVKTPSNVNPGSDSALKGPVFVHGMPEDNSWAAQISRLRSDNQALRWT